ncbi:MAG: hypothetical protein NT024_14375 [Proteobacteria bacterium]|nr:hypothetical protein [Pseudomonadota bacterium]
MTRLNVSSSARTPKQQRGLDPKGASAPPARCAVVLHSRPSQDLSVLAFGRRNVTSSHVARSVALTPHKGESHCDERRGMEPRQVRQAVQEQELSGTGFNVQLRALPVDGRIVLLPPDPANAESERSHKDR